MIPDLIYSWEIGCSAKGMFRRAKSYYKAFNKLNSDVVNIGEYFPVEIYLLCHSIELSLKSILINEGVSVTKLRSKKYFGHDLEKLSNRVSSIQMTEDEVIALQMINRQYSSKDMEYFRRGHYKIPSIKIIKGYAKKIFESQAVKEIER